MPPVRLNCISWRYDARLRGAGVPVGGVTRRASARAHARDVLPYATTHPAASLGLEDKIGSLTPGKQADVTVVNALDLNLFLAEPSAALVQAAHPGNVEAVLVAGRAVKRDGRLVGVDLAPLRRQARAANQRLLA